MVWHPLVAGSWKLLLTPLYHSFREPGIRTLAVSLFLRLGRDSDEGTVPVFSNQPLCRPFS